MKTDKCKDDRLYLAQLHRARTPTGHLSIAFLSFLEFFVQLVLIYLFSQLYLICAFKSLLLLLTLGKHTLYDGGRPILIIYGLSLSPLLLYSLFTLISGTASLAVNKAYFISSIATLSGFNVMALTETWIKPEDTATPAALSTNFIFSHTPRTTGRCGGTGLLI